MEGTMRRLYVLYDSRCELCCRLRKWLSDQEAWLELKTIPAGGEEARRLFPGLEAIASADDLVVVSDQGEVYLGNRAWIMCLFALKRYQRLACRLAHPLLLPLARHAYQALSKNRHLMSRWLRTPSSEALASELGQIDPPACSLPTEETIADYLR
jgi:predicted DCC family thiol-disulfide oxidoreductase YuxK